MTSSRPRNDVGEHISVNVSLGKSEQAHFILGRRGLDKSPTEPLVSEALMKPNFARGHPQRTISRKIGHFTGKINIRPHWPTLSPVRVEGGIWSKQTTGERVIGKMRRPHFMRVLAKLAVILLIILENSN